jgi:ferredoxin
MSTPPALWVRVDPRCEGHGLCQQLAPGVLDITDDEIAFCTEHPGSEHIDSIQPAVAAYLCQTIAAVDETGDLAKMKS